MSEEKLGFECKAYRNTGTASVPVWEEVERFRDVSVSMSKTIVDISRRQSSWMLKRGGLKDASVTAQYMYTAGTDADFTAIQDSYSNSTSIQWAFMDQDIANTGAQGLMAFSEVTDLSYDQPLDDAMVFNLEINPTAFEETPGTLIPPEWHIVP